MKDLSLPNINGYQLLENWSTSGSCRWSFAEKDGKQWFIKQFMAPKYKRAEDGISPRTVEKSHQRCEAFRQIQTALYSLIKEADNGNIIAVDDFFRYETMFYAVTERVVTTSLSIRDIACLEYDRKLILLKVLAHSLDSLHRKGVVHADLKPDNVLIKRTQLGYTFKLIDFDASFTESQPKRGEGICFDAGFVAPETIIAYNDTSVSLTRKIDIFSLGLLFHLYYTGHMPKIPREYGNVCEAVSEGIQPELDSSIPDWMKKLIRDMLDLNPGKRPASDRVFRALVNQCYPEETREAVSSGKKGFYAPIKQAGSSSMV